MFPSQPQIGKDMAGERRADAERFRQAEIARAGSAAAGGRTGRWWSRSARVVVRVLAVFRRSLDVPERG